MKNDQYYVNNVQYYIDQYEDTEKEEVLSKPKKGKSLFF